MSASLQCAIASLLERKRGKRGAPEGCVRLSQGQPYGRPARGDIEAQSTAYPCLAPRTGCELTTPGFHPRRVLEDPRGRIALLLPAERAVDWPRHPSAFRRLPQAPHPFPTWRDGPGHASLMGKRRAKYKGGARGGDSEGIDSAQVHSAPPLPLLSIASPCWCTGGHRLPRSDRVQRGLVCATTVAEAAVRSVTELRVGGERRSPTALHGRRRLSAGHREGAQQEAETGEQPRSCSTD